MAEEILALKRYLVGCAVLPGQPTGILEAWAYCWTGREGRNQSELGLLVGVGWVSQYRSGWQLLWMKVGWFSCLKAFGRNMQHRECVAQMLGRDKLASLIQTQPRFPWLILSWVQGSPVSLSVLWSFHPGALTACSLGGVSYLGVSCCLFHKWGSEPRLLFIGIFLLWGTTKVWKSCDR